MTKNAPRQPEPAAPEPPAPGGTAASTAKPPTPRPKLTICPYCGSRCRSLAACEACRGKFDPLSRQATQNAMGPWFIRDESNPHRPGCSYSTLVRMIARGKVMSETVLRGPGSRQFWTLARWCPGVAHLLGVCHSCQRSASSQDAECAECGASFVVPVDRQSLGLGEARAIPGQQLTAQPDEPHGADEIARAPSLERAAPSEIGPDPRLARIERELRRTRRWRTVWAVAFLLLLVGAAGAITIRALDLDAGPVGRLLRGGGGGTDDLTSDGGIPEIRTPALSAEPEPVGESKTRPDPVQNPPAPSEAEPSTGPEGGPGNTAPPLTPRLETLDRLRRLR